jgi:hypothetical protein
MPGAACVHGCSIVTSFGSLTSRLLLLLLVVVVLLLVLLLALVLVLVLLLLLLHHLLLVLRPLLHRLLQWLVRLPRL